MAVGPKAECSVDEPIANSSMFVLPRMTAPAVAQALRDVGVVRGAVALQDPRAGRALAAGHGDEVLERDRDAEQRLEPVERVRGVVAGRRQADVGGVGLGQGPLAIDRQPRVEAVVVAFGGGEVRLGQLARRDLAGAQERRPSRGRAAASDRSSRIAITAGSALVEDGRDDDEVAVARGRVGEDGLDRQGRADDVLAQDVLELDRLGGRRDVVGGSSARIAYWSRMWFSSPSSRRQLGVGQAQAGEVRDVLDVGAGQGGHGSMIADTPATIGQVHSPTIRPMTAADVDPVAAAFLRNDWGDRRLNLEFVTSHPETHPIVAEADGAVVGTGVLSVHGPVGWIGTIFVEPAWRRRGVGTGPDPGDDRDGRGRRAAGRSSSSRPRPAGRCTNGSGSRSRPYRVLSIAGLPDRAAPTPGCGRPTGDLAAMAGPLERCGHRRGPSAPAARLRQPGSKDLNRNQVTT